MFSIIQNPEDSEKVKRLYEEYKDILLNVAYGILKNRILAEDAVQDTFEKIIKNVHKIDEDNKYKTVAFLSIICRNTAINNSKNQLYLNKDENLHDEIVSVGKDTKNPLSIIIEKENRQLLIKLIKLLDFKYRDPIVLKYYMDFNYKQISKLLDISEEATRKRLQRAKEKLFEMINKEIEFDGK